MMARNAHELMRALETHSILDCADMAAHASLYRTESRWGLYHLRTDYPEKDNDELVLPHAAAQAGRPDDEREARRRSPTSCRSPTTRRTSTTSSASARAPDRPCKETRPCLSPTTQTTVPVVVDDAKCIADKGCTVCVDVCPLDVLRISDLTGKAYMAYDECWYCMPCEADCPTGAVKVNIPYLLR